MAHGSPGEKPGVMERIAVVAVAVSLASMIVTLAVVLGFKREVTQRIARLASHAVVAGPGGALAPDAGPVRRSERLEELISTTPEFVSAAPYALRVGIVRTDEAVEEAVLKGVGPAWDWSRFEGWIVEGALPRTGDSLRTKDILLSRTLAGRLALGVGDRVEMLFVSTDELPRRDRFKIAGLYASGLDEMDARLVFTDLRNVQRLSDWAPDEVSGYEIFVSDPESAGAYAEALEHRLFYDDAEETLNLSVSSVQALYPSVFDWLRAHDVNAAVIIVIMLLVAFFNMASAVMILVLERTRTIGLLKALGMTDGMLQRMFLCRAVFVALRGMAWGNGAGLALCLVQQRFGLLRLDAEGYLLSQVPVALDWGWLLALNGGVLAAIVLLLALPARVVSSVKPSETIRYE